MAPRPLLSLLAHVTYHDSNATKAGGAYKAGLAWRNYCFSAVLRLLEEMEAAYTPFKRIDVVVDTNEGNAYAEQLLSWQATRTSSPSRVTVQVAVHERRKLSHPFQLAWMHRESMTRLLEAYDWFMSVEADTLVPGLAMETQVALATTLYEQHGLVLGFVRLVNDSHGRSFYSDITKPVPRGLIVNLPGLGAFVTPQNSYAAVWAYPQPVMRAFMRSSDWLPKQQSSRGMRERAAWGWRHAKIVTLAQGNGLRIYHLGKSGMYLERVRGHNSLPASMLVAPAEARMLQQSPNRHGYPTGKGRAAQACTVAVPPITCPRCHSWCESHPTTWSKKCSFHFCNQCSSCLPLLGEWRSTQRQRLASASESLPGDAQLVHGSWPPTPRSALLVVVPGAGASSARLKVVNANLAQARLGTPTACAVFMYEHADVATMAPNAAEHCTVVLWPGRNLVHFLKLVQPSMVSTSGILVVLDDDALQFPVHDLVNEAQRLHLHVASAAIDPGARRGMPIMAPHTDHGAMGRLVRVVELHVTWYSRAAYRCYHRLLEPQLNWGGLGYDIWTYDFCLRRVPNLRMGILDRLVAVHTHPSAPAYNGTRITQMNRMEAVWRRHGVNLTVAQNIQDDSYDELLGQP